MRDKPAYSFINPNPLQNTFLIMSVSKRSRILDFIVTNMSKVN